MDNLFNKEVNIPSNSLDLRIMRALEDSPTIFARLNSVDLSEIDVLEIRAELPATLYVDSILAQISRWSDIAKHTGKNVRVYAWSYNDEVETYMQQIVANRDNIMLTVLPYYVKEDMYRA